MGRLATKRVIVTGAAQGIGKSAALACEAEGAQVIATDRNADALAALARERPAIRVYTLDGTDAAAISRFAENHQCDALIHCIGYVAAGSVLDCTRDDWDRSFAVNVDSFFNVVQAFMPTMLANGGGSMICIASVASSIKGVPNRAAYGASKAGMIGLVKSIAADYVGEGIRCNAVCPGTIESPSLVERIEALGQSVGGVERARAMFVSRQPLGRLGTPEEVAALCVYLSSDESKFVTSQTIAIDGGMTL